MNYSQNVTVEIMFKTKTENTNATSVTCEYWWIIFINPLFHIIRDIISTYKTKTCKTNAC